MVTTRFTVRFLAAVAMFGAALYASADDPSDSIGQTPPRLSYAEGEVSFWRPGAEDWAPAQVNTPLAHGDELYTGHGGHLELQVGNRAFVRAWGDTQVGLANQEPDFLQIKVTAGHAVARRALNLLGAAAMRQRLAIQHQSLGAYLPLSTRPKANAPDESR